MTTSRTKSDKCAQCRHSRESHISDKHGQSYCLKCTCNGFRMK